MKVAIFLTILAASATCQEPRAADPLQLANEYLRSGQPAKAAQLYREQLLHADRPDIRVFLGAALFSLFESDDAIAQARRALELDPAYAKAYTLLGRIYASKQQWQLSRQAHGHALALTPSNHEAWYFAGRALYEENAFPEAVEAFQRSLSLGGNYSRTHENLGLALDALGKSSDAESAFRRAIALTTAEYRPYLAYGAFLFRQGRVDEGIGRLEKAYALNPSSADVRFELARALYQQNRLDRAQAIVESAVVAESDCRLRHLLLRIQKRAGKDIAAGTEAKLKQACGY
jgi:tetratricopeptide (TPR) repeat protein